MEFKTIENCFKPINSWAWNDKLDSSYIKEHFDSICSVDSGGVFIAAQKGLSSKYMGEDWFRNLVYISSNAKERGLTVWLSDENGSSAGTGNGTINALILEYQQKFLRCEPFSGTNDRTIVCKDGYHFYYDINPGYVDVLTKGTGELFIKEIYNTYKEKSLEVDGFISIEPQISYKNIPWSFSLPAAYKDAYGEELLDLLPQLFHSVGDYKNTRIKFWTLVSKLFSENFFLPVHEFCINNNYLYSSALISDDIYDFTANGNKMMQFLNMDFPVTKVISKERLNPLSTLMAVSVAYQFNRKMPVIQICTEAAHSLSFSDLYSIAGLQFARGGGKIASAFETSSFKGIRKRTNPSYAYLRSDLKDSFKLYNNYCARIEKILAAGKVEFDTLLLSNLTSLWSEFNGSENNEVQEHYNSMLSAVYELEKKHIPFHIGDEFLLKENFYIEGNALCLGTQKYNTIVIPENALLLDSTQKILSEFEHNGGFITYASSIQENAVCDNENLLYTNRKADGYNINYFYNNSDEELTSVISAGTKMVNLTNGEILPFYGVHKFSPFEALVVIDDGTPETARPFKKPLKTLDISGDWSVEESFTNTLVLDKCDVYFDGELTHQDINAIDVTEIAYSLKQPVEIECLYNFNMDGNFQNIKIVYENKNFTLKINGNNVEFSPVDYYLDKTLPAVDISEYLVEGENVVSLCISLNPSDEIINAREIASNYTFATDKITYKAEFEPVYIVGKFSVNAGANIIKLNENSYRYIGDFKISEPTETCRLSDLHKQGFPFFCGELTLRKTFNLSDTQYAIKLVPKGVTSIGITVNEQKITTVLHEPYEADLSNHLVKGNNEIVLKISTPMRNLLGPHHNLMGEPLTVNPGIFYKDKTTWNNYNETPWECNYNLIEFGLY